MLIVMIVEMVSWTYPYVKIYQIIYLKYVQCISANYTLINVFREYEPWTVMYETSKVVKLVDFVAARDNQ